VGAGEECIHSEVEGGTHTHTNAHAKVDTDTHTSKFKTCVIQIEVAEICASTDRRIRAQRSPPVIKFYCSETPPVQG
jgi:hypothetical protein